MRYLHKASNTQIRKLLDNETTVGELMKVYREPEWCGYGPEAVAGVMGCWSLMDLHGARKKISPKFCQSCDCFIPGT